MPGRRAEMSLRTVKDDFWCDRGHSPRLSLGPLYLDSSVRKYSSTSPEAWFFSFSLDISPVTTSVGTPAGSRLRRSFRRSLDTEIAMIDLSPTARLREIRRKSTLCARPRLPDGFDHVFPSNVERAIGAVLLRGSSYLLLGIFRCQTLDVQF